MTAGNPDEPIDEVVVLGLLPHTRSPRVVHHDRDSSLRVRPAPVDAPTTHDTSPEPAPRWKLATPAALGPVHSSVAANNHEAEAPGALLSPLAIAVLSGTCAVVLAVAAVLLMRLVTSMALTSTTIATVSTGATAFCGLLLITASIVGHGGRR